jgi:hypothetical protein
MASNGMAAAHASPGDYGLRPTLHNRYDVMALSERDDGRRWWRQCSQFPSVQRAAHVARRAAEAAGGRFVGGVYVELMEQAHPDIVGCQEFLAVRAATIRGDA